MHRIVIFGNLNTSSTAELVQLETQASTLVEFITFGGCSIRQLHSQLLLRSTVDPNAHVYDCLMKLSIWFTLTSISWCSYLGTLSEHIPMNFLGSLNCNGCTFCRDLSKNNLSGNISDWIENLTRLQWLDLSNNLLNGPFPVWNNLAYVVHM